MDHVAEEGDVVVEPRDRALEAVAEVGHDPAHDEDVVGGGDVAEEDGGQPDALEIRPKPTTLPERYACPMEISMLRIGSPMMKSAAKYGMNHCSPKFFSAIDG